MIQFKSAIKLNQIYNLLTAIGIVADTKPGEQAFRNFVRCPLIRTPEGRLRPCNIQEETYETEGCDMHIERIEQSEGKEALNYLESLFERLQQEGLVGNQCEFSDFFTWCGGRKEVLEDLEAYLAGVKTRITPTRLPRQRGASYSKSVNREATGINR